MPPDKIEPLGQSQDCDSAKIAMAGTSKRSVKEAFSRAKQWLRRRQSHRSKSSSDPAAATGDAAEMSDDSSTDNANATDLDVDTAI